MSKSIHRLEDFSGPEISEGTHSLRRNLLQKGTVHNLTVDSVVVIMLLDFFSKSVTSIIPHF